MAPCGAVLRELAGPSPQCGVSTDLCQPDRHRTYVTLSAASWAARPPRGWRWAPAASRPSRCRGAGRDHHARRTSVHQWASTPRSSAPPRTAARTWRRPARCSASRCTCRASATPSARPSARPSRLPKLGALLGRCAASWWPASAVVRGHGDAPEAEAAERGALHAGEPRGLVGARSPCCSASRSWQQFAIARGPAGGHQQPPPDAGGRRVGHHRGPGGAAAAFRQVAGCCRPPTLPSAWVNRCSICF